MSGEHVFYPGLMASALNFGPDGALYIADWIGKWKPNGEGKIYKVDERNAGKAQVPKRGQSDPK